MPLISHTPPAQTPRLQATILGNLPEPLVKHLDHGFDPQHRAGLVAPTFMERAEAFSPEMGQLIHAHQARKKSARSAP